jgi:hypothetical protein
MAHQARQRCKPCQGLVGGRPGNPPGERGDADEHGATPAHERHQPVNGSSAAWSMAICPASCYSEDHPPRSPRGSPRGQANGISDQGRCTGGQDRTCSNSSIIPLGTILCALCRFCSESRCRSRLSYSRSNVRLDPSEQRQRQS